MASDLEKTVKLTPANALECYLDRYSGDKAILYVKINNDFYPFRYPKEPIESAGIKENSYFSIRLKKDSDKEKSELIFIQDKKRNNQNIAVSKISDEELRRFMVRQEEKIRIKYAKD